MALHVSNEDKVDVVLGYDTDTGHFYLSPGVQQSVLIPLSNRMVQHKISVSASAGTSVAADTTNGNPIFVAPEAMTLVKIDARPRVKSSAGGVTMQVFKADSGTALGSGTAMLSTQLALDQADNTNITGAVISASAGVADVAAGQTVGIKASGAVTALVDLVVTLTFIPKVTANVLVNVPA